MEETDGRIGGCVSRIARVPKAGNHVYSLETKVQLMLALDQLFVSKKFKPAASAPSAGSAPVTWERVVKEMIAVKPHFADCAT